MKLLAILPLVAATASAASVPSSSTSYDGYKVFRVHAGDKLADAQDVVKKMNLETWKVSESGGGFADVMVPPDLLDSFSESTSQFETETMHDDLGKSIAEQSDFTTYAAGSADSSWFDSYHSYDDHLQFLDDLQSQYPDNSEIVTSGASLNDRPITGIHFYGSSGGGKKPAVVFHGTVHAREWISTMVVEYMAFHMLTNYDSSSDIKGFMDKYDFYFFPIVNPDGFVYTQSSDRMWRKNRQSTSGSRCIGHDINRNWDYKWDVSGGASDNPCAADFRGRSPADAPETQALEAFLKETQDKQGVKLYIDFHSYSELFMSPYGYTCSKATANSQEYHDLAEGTTSAIAAVNGVQYDYGPICTTIYIASGSSVDWVQDVLGGDYAFAMELRDRGRYGFVLPADQIRPSGEETYEGMAYLFANMN